MTRTAQVRSLDALPRLAAALQAFATEVSISLDDLGMQIQRAVQWVQYDQKEYWTQQYRRAQEDVTEARINLERRKMFRVGDQEPSCHEEKKALEAAKRRVELARQKIEAVKRWTRLLEHESMDCRSGVAPLAGWAQADVPRATSLLKHLGVALEAYVDAQGPAHFAGAELIATAEAAAAAEETAAPRPEPASPAEPQTPATDAPEGSQDAASQES